MTLLSRAHVSPYQHSIETMSVSHTVSWRFSVKECRDLEIGGGGGGVVQGYGKWRSAIDHNTTFYWSAISSMLYHFRVI